MINLCVKQHNQTLLKYLCKTIRPDPENYSGSGTYWKRHLKIYGNDVSTYIIGSYETKEELKEAGIYYSKVWNIVESDEWANLKEENGDGGAYPALFGKSNPSHRPYIKERFIERISGKNSLSKRIEVREKIADKKSKNYILISPQGETIQIRNLKRFAQENNLNQGNLVQVVQGKRKHHKGWISKIL